MNFKSALIQMLLMSIFGASIGAPSTLGQATVCDVFLDEMERHEPGSREFLLAKLKVTDAFTRVDQEAALKYANEAETLAKELNDFDLEYAALVDRQVIESTLDGSQPYPQLNSPRLEFSENVAPEIKAHILIALLEFEIWQNPKTNVARLVHRLGLLEEIRSKCRDYDMARQIDVVVAFAKRFRLNRVPQQAYARLVAGKESPKTIEAQIICKMIEAQLPQNEPAIQLALLDEARELAEKTSNERFLSEVHLQMAQHIQDQKKMELVSTGNDSIAEQRHHFTESVNAARRLKCAPILFDRLSDLINFENRFGNPKFATDLKDEQQLLDVSSRPDSLSREPLANVYGKPNRAGKPLKLNRQPILPRESRKDQTNGTLIEPENVTATIIANSLMIISSMIGISLIAWALYRKVSDTEKLKSVTSESNNIERRQQHIESLVRLASGVAHDFNNSLTGVMGNVEVMQIKNAHNQDEVIGQSINRIMRSAEQAASLSKDMLSCAGKTAVNRIVQDIDQIITDMLPELQSSFDDRTLRFEKSINGLVFKTDREQIQVAVRDLVKNAAAATSEGGRITIRTGTEQIFDLENENLHGIRRDGGEFGFVEVEDDGHGIAVNDQERVFDPFFKKFTGERQGRGLGLSRVLGIAIGHRGFVRCQSDENVGSTFRILVPLTESETVARVGSTSPHAVRPQRDNCRILVIDDESSIRELCFDILSPAGHQVVLAENGQLGLDLIVRDPSNFDCVFLDVQMPTMTGAQVLDKLEKLRIEIPVIVMTGYSEEDMDVIQGYENVRHVINKPFSVVEILKAVNIW